MAQLRQDYQKFVNCNAVILVLGPDGPNAFRRYWAENEMPFIGLADIHSKIGDLYYQKVNLLKFGRMPAVFVIDRAGLIRYVHYGNSMSDIPENSEIIAFLDQLNSEK